MRWDIWDSGAVGRREFAASTHVFVTGCNKDRSKTAVPRGVQLKNNHQLSLLVHLGLRCKYDSLLCSMSGGCYGSVWVIYLPYHPLNNKSPGVNVLMSVGIDLTTAL